MTGRRRGQRWSWCPGAARGSALDCALRSLHPWLTAALAHPFLPRPIPPTPTPQDIVSELPERFFVAEIIRKHIMQQYRQEIPYGVAGAWAGRRQGVLALSTGPVLAAALHAPRQAPDGPACWAPPTASAHCRRHCPPPSAALPPQWRWLNIGSGRAARTTLKQRWCWVRGALAWPAASCTGRGSAARWHAPPACAAAPAPARCLHHMCRCPPASAAWAADKERLKGILIGHKGSALKQLSTASRVEIEEFLERPVYLQISLKARAWGWQGLGVPLHAVALRVGMGAEPGPAAPLHPARRAAVGRCGPPRPGPAGARRLAQGPQAAGAAGLLTRRGRPGPRQRTHGEPAPTVHFPHALQVIYPVSYSSVVPNLPMAEPVMHVATGRSASAAQVSGRWLHWLPTHPPHECPARPTPQRVQPQF